MLTIRRVPAFVFVIGIIATLAGCGSGGGSPVLIHNTGNFSDSSLKGAYVFQMHGFVPLNNGFLQPYRQVGVFTADGNGNITAGTDDSSLSPGGTAITGTYNVISTGFGLITFNNSSLGPIQLAIVIVNSSTINIIENDAGVSAAGTAQLQDPNAAGVTPAGTFVFHMHQDAAAQNTADTASEVGAFTVANGAGTGAMDQNLAGNSFSSPAITLTFNAPSASGRGTATLINGSSNFTTNLVYYTVNSGAIALLVDSSLNANAVGSGFAEGQSGDVTAGLSGNYAFGSRGDDSVPEGVATVGQFSAASGQISGTEDVVEQGSYTPSVNISLCFTTAAAGGINGRVAATNCQSQTASQVFWMVNPGRAFFVNNTAGQVVDGTADLQTVNSFSLSSFDGQFVFLMDGLDQSGELSGLGDAILSRIGLMQFDGAGSWNLSEQFNEFNGAQPPVGGGLTGQYSVSAANGKIMGSVSNSSVPPLNLVMYAVSGSQAYVLQAITPNDLPLTMSGMIVLQQQ